MKSQRLGQEPQLGGNRVHPFPIVEAEDRERELPPGRRGGGAAVRLEKTARAGEPGSLRGGPEEPEGHVGEGGREHVARALDVETPAAVRALMTAEIALHALAGLRVEV